MFQRKWRQRLRIGTTLVEVAICISATIVFMFGIFEYGRFLMVRDLLDNAAREGTRYAIVNTSTTPVPDIQTYITPYLANQPVTITSFSCYKSDPVTGANLSSWVNAGFGDTICVDIQATYSPMLPTFGFLPTTVNMRSKSIMRCESN